MSKFLYFGLYILDVLFFFGNREYTFYFICTPQSIVYIVQYRLHKIACLRNTKLLADLKNNLKMKNLFKNIIKSAQPQINLIFCIFIFQL